MAATSLTATISAKGQVTLPKVFRERLHWNPGIRLIVEHTADSVLLKPLTPAFAPTQPESVFGCLAGTGEPRSMEQMDAGVAVEIKRRHANDQ